MAEESKSAGTKQAGAEAKDKGKAVVVESDDELDVSDELEDDHDAAASGATATTTGGNKKKKKSKRKKIKDVLTNKKDGKEAQVHKAIEGLTSEQTAQLLEMNPALRNEMARLGGGEDVSEAFKRLNLQEIMTGLAASGKNVKDMGGYKFWSTQPVPKFGEDTGKAEERDHPIRNQSVDEVPKEGSPLLHGFEWCEVDLENEAELNEVRELLYGHYVEDDEEMFRFNYSASIMKWALMPPGWKKQWFVGVRASQSRRLVGFISAVPIELRVRKTILHASEVNFLCIHKKLRSKRLAPVLIKEITRRCNLESVWQALYTAGIVLPTPVSTCRYFHRAINWQKLYEVGFSPLPPNSKPQYQVRKYALPDHTSLKGLRVMQEKDVDAVHGLLMRYLARFDLAPDFTKEDVIHWLLHEKQEHKLKEQIMWSYVVEDEDKKITDFFSFYCLESSILRESKHKNVRAAYLFYYATETGLTDPVDRSALKTRLQALMHDCLILCKKLNFDVLNALSLMDNGLFLEDLKFGPGDGQLHYYLFNYKAAPIAGGVDKKNQLDTDGLSGVGFTML